MPDYLSHHGFRRGAPEPSRTTGRPCEVCGLPMLAGQTRRHGVCSPKLSCCGAFEDLVGDPAEHARQHAEIDEPDPDEIRAGLARMAGARVHAGEPISDAERTALEHHPEEL